MRFAFLPLKDRVFALPTAYARTLSGSLAFLTLTDWGVNFFIRI